MRYCQVCKPPRCSLRPVSLPPRRPPRSILTSDFAQFALPFSPDSVLTSDQNRVPAEPSRSGTHSPKKTRSAGARPEPQSAARDIGGRRRRNETAGSATADAITPDAKVLVSRKAAAAMLSISIRGVDYMIAAKRLSTRRIANRVLIPVDEIRRFARSDHPERMAG
jgi:hypothetical protein